MYKFTRIPYTASINRVNITTYKYFVKVRNKDHVATKTIYRGISFMTNEKVIEELLEIRTYCTAPQLDSLNYVIEVMKKLDKDGVKKPLETDFTKLKDK